MELFDSAGFLCSVNGGMAFCLISAYLVWQKIHKICINNNGVCCNYFIPVGLCAIFHTNGFSSDKQTLRFLPWDLGETG